MTDIRNQSFFAKKIKAILLRPDYLTLILALILLAWHLKQIPFSIKPLLPENVHNYTVSMTFETGEDEIEVKTFLPENNDRQKIINESIYSRDMEYSSIENNSGRIASWSGTDEANSIIYRALIKTSAVHYQIDKKLKIRKKPSSDLSEALKETDVVQISHPEIQTLWKTIKPSNPANAFDTLQAIFNYTHKNIQGAPFKGTTDALTALRLGQASCNGKSRLFTALARLNGLPSRLVGGVILTTEKKKTSHQWIEVFLENHWIPFDPTNGHFASLPENYLELYRGDEPLFTHSSNINFDYYFDSNSQRIAPELYRNRGESTNREQTLNIAVLLQDMGLNPKTTILFLLFPICTLIITFLRNMIGVKTFSIFLPMLIAAVSLFTGFWTGVIGFVAVLSTSTIAHIILEKFRLLKIPRLAAVITLNTLFFIAILMAVDVKQRLEFGMLSLFPVIIISFVAERVSHATSEKQWFEIFSLTFGTFITIVICYFVFQSVLLQGAFAIYPELFLIVLAGQIYLGRWSGIRISEMFRFKNILGSDKSSVLGINQRNRDYVYKFNHRSLLALAADKLASKQALEKFHVPIPGTIKEIRSFADLESIEEIMIRAKKFVIKPNNGSQGNGIVVIVNYINNKFISAGGRKLTTENIKQHIGEILAGTYSQNGEADIAYLEPLIIQHQSLQKVAPYGLSDIRVILSHGKIISCMLRMPTSGSSGKANLHQGAVGVAVNIDSGISERAQINGTEISEHPDSHISMVNIQIPFWQEICTIAKKSQQAVPLGYIGVDISLDEKLGPLVLEVNGRPGLEIQNVQDRGMQDALVESLKNQ